MHTFKYTRRYISNMQTFILYMGIIYMYNNIECIGTSRVLILTVYVVLFKFVSCYPICNLASYSKLNNSPYTYTQDPFCWQKSEGYVKKYTFLAKKSLLLSVIFLKPREYYNLGPRNGQEGRVGGELHYKSTESFPVQCAKVLRNARGLAGKAKKLFIFHVQRSFYDLGKSTGFSY